MALFVLAASFVGASIGLLVADHAERGYTTEEKGWCWLFASLLAPVLVYVGLTVVGMWPALSPVVYALVGAVVAVEGISFHSNYH